MKKIFLYMALASAAALPACSEEQGGGNNGQTGTELTFTAAVDEMARGAGNEFFEPGHGIDVTITSSRTGAAPVPYQYTYHDDGVFRSDNGFRFPLDDTYITELVAVWPTDEIRREKGIVTDQSDKTEFQFADWLTATAEIDGLMATDTPVPLKFSRQNSMLEFQLAGQHAEGQDIQSLIIELQINGTPTAFRAYCGSENGHAQLIVEGGVTIESPEGYLIGRMSVSDQTEYTIIFPMTNITVEPGKRYLVTLTPQGYDIDAFVYIGGWAQTESGIGVPFSPPEPDIDGNFIIDSPVKLITMSYLIRHYYDPGNFDWTTRTYVIADGFRLTEDIADRYIPVPRGIFSGQIVQDGAPITRIEYGDGNILELYQ